LLSTKGKTDDSDRYSVKKFHESTVNLSFWITIQSNKELQLISILNLNIFVYDHFFDSWNNYDDLLLILKHIPDVKELIIKISADDDNHLIDEKQLFILIFHLSL
jgi:hypothetical protein